VTDPGDNTGKNVLLQLRCSKFAGSHIVVSATGYQLDSLQNQADWRSCPMYFMGQLTPAVDSSSSTDEKKLNLHKSKKGLIVLSLVSAATAGLLTVTSSFISPALRKVQ